MSINIRGVVQHIEAELERLFEHASFIVVPFEVYYKEYPLAVVGQSATEDVLPDNVDQQERKHSEDNAQVEVVYQFTQFTQFARHHKETGWLLSLDKYSKFDQISIRSLRK